MEAALPAALPRTMYCRCMEWQALRVGWCWWNYCMWACVSKRVWAMRSVRSHERRKAWLRCRHACMSAGWPFAPPQRCAVRTAVRTPDECNTCSHRSTPRAPAWTTPGCHMPRMHTGTTDINPRRSTDTCERGRCERQPRQRSTGCSTCYGTEVMVWRC